MTRLVEERTLEECPSSSRIRLESYHASNHDDATASDDSSELLDILVSGTANKLAAKTPYSIVDKSAQDAHLLRYNVQIGNADESTKAWSTHFDVLAATSEPLLT